ncbi:MAG TPA: IS4 family transposase [Actinocrinis sp.]|nr:IS4 family transposase [Actinocrinis sp.]
MSDDAGGAQESDKGSIGLLAQVFPRGVVDTAIGRAGVKELKTRALPARLMVYFVIGMWLWSGVGYVRVLRKVTAGLRWAAEENGRAPLPYDGSIAKARARLGEAVMADLFAGCAGPVGRAGEDGVFFAGLRVASLDGTVFDVKPTPQNLAAFAVPAGGVLPQVRLLAFAECGTMALLGAVFDSIGVDERTLVTRLLPRFAPGMLVLADRGFPSFELWRDAAGTGADLAWRVSASFTLPILEVLPDGTYLSRLRGRRKGEQIVVRVVEYSVRDADTGISEVFALITTLLDPAAYPAEALAQLYACRWQVEILFKILKVEIRGSHAVLRSKSPAMVRQEMWGLLCCYQAVRLVTAHVAHRADTKVTRIKFPELLDAVRDCVATAISPL